MAIITYDGDEFKSIDCIPEYADYPTIYVAKTPHVDETGRAFQVINTAWGQRKITHPVYDHELNTGYYHVNLPRLKGETQMPVSLHRLVLLTWQVELPANYRELQVNHIDENKGNNRFENLEFVTASYNCNWGSRNRRISETKTRTGQTIKVVAVNIQTRTEYIFSSICDCAHRLDLNVAHVWECVKGKLRQHKGFVFCREEDYSPALVDELIARATRVKTKN